MTPPEGWLIRAGIAVHSMEGAEGVEALLKGEIIWRVSGKHKMKTIKHLLGRRVSSAPWIDVWSNFFFPDRAQRPTGWPAGVIQNLICEMHSSVKKMFNGNGGILPCQKKKKWLVSNSPKLPNNIKNWSRTKAIQLLRKHLNLRVRGLIWRFKE